MSAPPLNRDTFGGLRAKLIHKRKQHRFAPLLTYEVDQSLKFAVPRHPHRKLTVSHIFAKPPNKAFQRSGWNEIAPSDTSI
jgi:hypothetical protein